MELYLGVVHTPEMKARLRWRGKPESEAFSFFFFLFFSKAKQSERSRRVNEYAVCCHALFLYPAVVRGREKGEKLFLDQGSLAAPAPTATNDADYTKHMLFPQHKHTSDRFSRAFRPRQDEQPLSVATQYVTKCTTRHTSIHRHKRIASSVV